MADNYSKIGSCMTAAGLLKDCGLNEEAME